MAEATSQTAQLMTTPLAAIMPPQPAAPCSSDGTHGTSKTTHDARPSDIETGNLLGPSLRGHGDDIGPGLVVCKADTSARLLGLLLATGALLAAFKLGELHASPESPGAETAPTHLPVSPGGETAPTESPEDATWGAPQQSFFSPEKFHDKKTYKQACKDLSKQPRLVMISQGGVLSVSAEAAAEAGIDLARTRCTKEEAIAFDGERVGGAEDWYPTGAAQLVADVAVVKCNYCETADKNCEPGTKGAKVFKTVANWVPFKKPHVQTEFQRYNVPIFMMDSLSDAAFTRLMPKTNKVLQEAGAVRFEQNMAVGDSTITNMIPMLMGRKANQDFGEEEFAGGNLRTDVAEPYDDQPFIWDDMRALGYTTGYSDDLETTAAFRYRDKNFASSPTDHYGLNWYNAARKFGFRDGLYSEWKEERRRAPLLRR